MGVKVHVTGGKGFLGKYISDTLGADDGIELELSDVDTLDVTDQAAVVAAFSAKTPDVVVHLAGLMGAGASLKDPRRFFETNCVGTLNVLEACRQAGVPGFVFMSSLTVHGRSDGGPVNEDSPMRPLHAYSGSKAAAEPIVQTYARCFGMRAAILRATLIAGEGQSEPNAIGDFVDSVLSGTKIEIYGEGTHRREWLHPIDLATAVHAAALRVAAEGEASCETYVVSSGEPISMADLAKRVIAQAGKGELEFQPSTRQAFDLTSDSDRMTTELGWKPSVSIDDIIGRFLAASAARIGGAAAE
jgi:dTDP-glucose 4,6-dehydratase